MTTMIHIISIINFTDFLLSFLKHPNCLFPERFKMVKEKGIIFFLFVNSKRTLAMIRENTFGP